MLYNSLYITCYITELLYNSYKTVIYDCYITVIQLLYNMLYNSYRLSYNMLYNSQLYCRITVIQLTVI